MQQLCCLVCHFYPRSPHGERPSITSEIARLTTSISIHALRMESDARRKYNRYAANYFYPRSPHGERLKKTVTATDEQLDFYPRSPHGERQLILRGILARPKFLSTLSAWRATSLNSALRSRSDISIHALRMESDLQCLTLYTTLTTFLSTLSAWRATPTDLRVDVSIPNFYPRSPHGERLLIAPRIFIGKKISIHALRMESDRKL